MPFSSQYFSNSVCCSAGCASIWFIAGTTPVALMIFSRCSTVKFDTPMLFALPVFCTSIMAFQVSTMLGASVSMSICVPSAFLVESVSPGGKGTGQWIW